MSDITALKALYETYYQNAVKARQGASAFAGVFGMGDDPRRHPCHDAFYEALAQWVEEFAAAAPDTAAVNEVVRWILEAPLHNRGTDTFWYLYAAQGHTKALIPLLDASDRKALAQWYEDSFPKRERLPVQAEVCKLLKQEASKQRKKLFW